MVTFQEKRYRSLSQPPHRPMGPGALALPPLAAPFGTKKNVIKEKRVASAWKLCYTVSKLKKTQKGEATHGKRDAEGEDRTT